MKTINNELPKVIYDEARFNEAVTTICNDVESQSNKAIKSLKAHFKGEIDNNIESLNTFANEALFQSFLKDAKQSYIGAIRFLPDSEKERIDTLYNNLYDTCIDSVRTLQRLFALPYHLSYDGTSLTADKDEISKKIKPNFVVNLTDEQREYFRLMANTVNALNTMNDFEERHNYVRFSFSGINSLSRLGYFRKVSPMVFYQSFNETHFIDALKNGTIGKERDD